MAAKTSWHRYRTILDHCLPMYISFSVPRESASPQIRNDISMGSSALARLTNTGTHKDHTAYSVATGSKLAGSILGCVLSGNTRRQVVHTHVPPSPNSIILVRSKGCTTAGKANVGVVSHWPYVKDLSGIDMVQRRHSEFASPPKRFIVLVK